MILAFVHIYFVSNVSSRPVARNIFKILTNFGARYMGAVTSPLTRHCREERKIPLDHSLTHYVYATLL